MEGGGHNTTAPASPNMKVETFQAQITILKMTFFKKEGDLGSLLSNLSFPSNKYMLKLNNRNTRRRSKICSKFAIKTPGGTHWRRSGLFIVNFEHISHLFLVFLSFFIVAFEQVNVSWLRKLNWMLSFLDAKSPSTTITDIIFWDFLILYENFLFTTRETKRDY